MKNTILVIQPYIIPRSDFIFLAHTKSHSTAKALAKILFFSSFSIIKLMAEREKWRRRAESEAQKWLQCWRPWPLDLQSIPARTLQVTNSRHALNARAEQLLARQAGLLHPSQDVLQKKQASKINSAVLQETHLYICEQDKNEAFKDHKHLINTTKFALGRGSQLFYIVWVERLI